MKKLFVICLLFAVSFVSHAHATESVDRRCQAPGMSTLDESNCYFDAIQAILHGDQVPDAILDYCHSEEGGACDDFNGLSATECMNACIYHQISP